MAHVLSTLALVTAPHIPATANVLGWCGGTIGTAISWPQVWRLWHDRRYAGLSLTTGALGLLTPIAWTTYGVVTNSLVQIVTNAIVVVGAALVLTGQVVLARPAVRAWLPLFVAGFCVIGAALAVGPTTVGLLATATTIGGILPQLYVLARDRRGPSFDASGVARGRWALSVVCNSFWLGYGLLAPDRVITLSAVLVLMISSSVLLLTIPPRVGEASWRGMLPLGARAR